MAACSGSVLLPSGARRAIGWWPGVDTGRRRDRVRLRRDPSTVAGCLLGVGTALFVSGLFFPFLSSELSTATLFDLPGTTIGIYVGLCIVACIAVPFALAGGQRGAADRIDAR